MDFPARCEFETPPSSSLREWRSRDGRFVVRVSETLWSPLEEVCADAGRLETGGVLAGRYEEDGRVARVLAWSRPPRDSRRAPFGFTRGAAGLRRWLSELWPQGVYYLGEWHLHPGGPPVPSGTDIGSLRAIADDPAYQCRSPLLLIVGGAAPAWRSTLWVCAGGRLLPLDEQPPAEDELNPQAERAR